MIPPRRYPKRLIEVDLPISRISAHARREKSIRHGHISTLHIWWARRPLAACRAVILASLWPDPESLASWDPADASVKPDRFLAAAREQMQRWADDSVSIMTSEGGDMVKLNRGSPASQSNLVAAKLDRKWLSHPGNLRTALLDFIADFADWDNSTNPDYLALSRTLTQAAHEALGGEPGSRPLVIDPFAGGGSIPLEALRVGADAFASDLNPIPVLLNKVVLEYIPKYGQKLADEVRKWGQWVKEEAEKELAQYYPKDSAADGGGTPIAYLWARTILSEAPGGGDIPVEVPLMRSLWLAKKANRRRALRWVRDDHGKVKTQTVEVTYVIDGKPQARKVKRPLLEIFEPKKESEVEGGTVARGNATCPVTGFTTKVASVRAQLKRRSGGANDARMFCVILTRPSEQGRHYRLPTEVDEHAASKASNELQRRVNDEVADTPCEVLPIMSGVFNAPIYGHSTWGSLFSPRQMLVLTTLCRLIKSAGEKIDSEQHVASTTSGSFGEAVQVCLSLALDRQADFTSSICGWWAGGEKIQHTFGRQALPMIWDFVECPVFADATGSWDGAYEWGAKVSELIARLRVQSGQVVQASATQHPLPDDYAACLFTDPPYYNAVPYADLSDFFYVWLKRSLPSSVLTSFTTELSPKEQEICEMAGWDAVRYGHKDGRWFEQQMRQAMFEGRRVTRPEGVGIVVFAHKSTDGWEAQLKSIIEAGWVVTGSWPIDTEMETRLRAMGSAALASSVHLVIRPREGPDGTPTSAEVGEWREVLEELPTRMAEWMPRLSAEGVVGADAIFACLGPALEIFSRYSRVERADGSVVTLREYLEHVWSAVSTEALSLIFNDADAAGLEPDARLTSMWLWTLGGGKAAPGGTAESGDDAEGDDEEDESPRKAKAGGGYVLEFDAARKIAQGLGVHLEKCTAFLEVSGETARLLGVGERVKYLFGKDAEGAKADELPGGGGKKGKKKKAEPTLFQSMEEVKAEVEKAEAEAAGKLAAEKPGATVLDRVHQAMLLFSAGRGEALRRFIVDDGIGNDARFWRLADSLQKLYPPGTDERRWVEGVLARKKGFGF